MKKNTTLRMCLVAVFAALYFVLTMYLTIRIGNITITLASLPVLLLAVLYRPVESAVAAALGELLHQVLTYGLTVTTPLWILPPVIRGLIVAFGCILIRKKTGGQDPWKKPVWFFALLILAAAVTTVFNTGITWLDSIIFHYYTFAYVFGDFMIRFFTGIATAVVMGVILPPTVIAIRNAVR